MTERVITLDVRADIQEGREPFSRIIQAAAGLRNGEALLLIAPFEPVPLYRIMARQGFSYKCRPAGTGDWEVLFSRGPAGTAPDSPTAPKQS